MNLGGNGLAGANQLADQLHSDETMNNNEPPALSSCGNVSASRTSQHFRSLDDARPDATEMDQLNCSQSQPATGDHFRQDLRDLKKPLAHYQPSEIGSESIPRP
jgi:hypothetical protein